MKRLATVLTAVAASALLLTGAATAQDATPVAPEPALCTLTPPTIEELAMYAASPVPEASGIAEATPAVELPAGEPVDDATRAAVEQSMIVNVACLNTGSTLMAMAAYSDAALADLVAGAGAITQAQYDSLATAQAIPEDQWTVIYEFQDMVALPDGRVAAIIVGDNQADDSAPAGPTLFYLIEQDGHWYIDDFVNPD